jgi:hypothetical protein
MSLSRCLVRLYPGSLRDRWGSGLEAEAQACGWKSLLNLVVSILDMWLHPVVWPAKSSAQRRRRAAAMAVAIALSGWLLGYMIVQVGTLIPASLEHSWSLETSDILVLLGLVLVAPRPRFTPGALAALLRQVARRLALPLALGAGVLVAVHLGSMRMSAGFKHVELVCWWIALALGAIQVCQVVASLGTDVIVPPRPRRLRLGIGVLGAAFALGGSVVLGSGFASGHLGPLAATLGAGLLLLTITCAATLRDLGHVPTERSL